MQAHSPATLSAAFADLVAAQSPRVVAVHSHRSRASGFAWRPDLVVTSEEALAEQGEIAVALPGGETRPAALVGRDAATDVALLRVEGAALTPVEFASPTVRAGEIALVVGAEGGEALAALGLVARSGASWLSLRGGRIDARIELDMRLRRAAEGGLVVDAEGRALGMAVFGPRRRVLVIPAATIERVAGALLQHGRVARGFLGLGLLPVRLDGIGAAAFVSSVAGDGPAARAGVRPGDVVVGWNGEPLGNLSAMLRALGPESVGQSATLAVQRGGEPIELTLTIGERAQE